MTSSEHISAGNCSMCQTADSCKSQRSNGVDKLTDWMVIRRGWVLSELLPVDWVTTDNMAASCHSATSRSITEADKGRYLKSMENGEFWPSGAPKPTELKIGTIDYVRHVTACKNWWPSENGLGVGIGEVVTSHAFLCPRPIGEGHYKMNGGICLSVRPSVACLNLIQERKCLGSPNLVGWVTREPI